jgi:hypothetical protein
MHIACSQEKIPRFAAHHRFVSCPSSSFSFSCHSTEKEWKEEHQCCAKQVWPILVEKLLLTRKKWGHKTGRHSTEDLVQWQSMIMGRLHHFWDMPFISSRRDEPQKQQHTPQGKLLANTFYSPLNELILVSLYFRFPKDACHCCCNPPAAPLAPDLTAPLPAPFCPVGPPMLSIPP